MKQGSSAEFEQIEAAAASAAAEGAASVTAEGSEGPRVSAAVPAAGEGAGASAPASVRVKSGFKGVASRALAVFALFTVVCGLGYTLVVTGVAQLVFPHQANGSLIEADGKVLGSELIAQNFEDEGHMWGRIQNATFVEGDDGELRAYGAPSNLSPASDEYAALVEERVAKLRAANPDATADTVPVDLVTCSGSGLDPEISPAAAEYQVPRIAEATGKSEDEVRQIVRDCTTGRFLGVFGEPRVNVLKVNLMLDGEL
ncbi:MAG: potassium-transporting ATPase subunit KdpC [Coriobacteriaceae bacterium]|nr:potassium-transporting ATPase subunit KdpC [Coriobacteriaceae bacterium]